jgi:Baseplate J-like protein
MDYIKSTDQLIAEGVQDMGNLDPDVDVAQATLTFLQIACRSSALWGIYKYIQYVATSRFPDLCNSEDLQHYASNYGITPQVGESNASLLARVFQRLQNPPAGGNVYDYEDWVRSVSRSDWTEWAADTETAVGDVCKPSVSNGWLYICTSGGTTGNDEPVWKTDGTTTDDNGVEWTKWNADTYIEHVKDVKIDKKSRGPGTFDIVVTTDSAAAGMEEEPTPGLLTAIFAYIDGDEIRPLNDFDFGVQAPEKNKVAVVFNVPAGTSQAVKDSIKGDAQAYMRSLSIGATLYLAPLEAITIKYNLPQAVLTTPAAAVTCWPTGNAAHYQRIWEDTITFNEV